MRIVDRIHDEVISRDPVKRCHVERGSGRALLNEAGDMKVIRIRTTMHDLMNRARESVKREDHVDRLTAKSPKLGRSSGRLIGPPLACGDALIRNSAGGFAFGRAPLVRDRNRTAPPTGLMFSALSARSKSGLCFR